MTINKNVLYCFSEQFFLVISLVLLSGGILPIVNKLLGDATDPETTGNPIYQVVFLGIYLVIFGLCVSRYKAVLRLLRWGTPLWALILLALFSVLWSNDPPITLRRSIALVQTGLFGVYLAAVYSLRQQLRLLVAALSLAAVLSFAVALLAPEYGIALGGINAGTWTGIYLQKNYLARMMMLGLWALFLLPMARSKLKWALLGLTFLLMLLAQSAAAIMFFGVLVGIYLVIQVIRIDQRVFGMMVSGGLLIGFFGTLFLVQNVETLLALVRQYTPLTPETGGRLTLWRGMWTAMSQAPILGYGYGAFWVGGSTGLPGQAWQFLPEHHTWRPGHGHNGFMDLFAQLGFVGVAVFIFSFAQAYYFALQIAYLKRTREAMWPIMFLSFLLIYNITESVIVKRNNIFFALYVAMYLSVIQEYYRLKRELRSSAPSHSLYF